MDAHIKATDWTPPVQQTVGVEDIGVEELWQAIGAHRKFLKDSGTFHTKRRERTYNETLRMIHNELFKAVRDSLQETGRLDRAVEDILDRKRDPYSLMRKIVSEWLSIPQLHKEAS